VLAQRLVFPEPQRCEVEEFDLDERLGPGEVLVRNRLALIGAGTDLEIFTRTHRAFLDPDSAYARYPFYPGGAAVGDVIAGAGDLKPGTRVFHPGRHATFAKARSNACLALPEGLADQQAVFLGLAQAALAAPRVAPARLGEHVLVLGAAPVGNLCAQLYQLSGAGRVAVADLSAPHLAQARLCGLEKCFNLNQKPLAAWLPELGPRGAELVVEATGASSALRDALKAVAERGIVVLLGSPRGKLELDPHDLYAKGIALVGAHAATLGPDPRRADVSLLLDWLRTGKLWVEPLITQRLPFSGAEFGYLGLRDQPDEHLVVLLNCAP